MELVNLDLYDIIPYENNPRHNEFAVEAVCESIRQCGFIAPIIVDEDYVILAGHTRALALVELGYEEAPCIIMDGLTDEQKRKFRILDNKTAEIAEWDYDLLKEELKELELEGFSWFDDLMNPHVTLAAEEKAESKGAEKEDDGVIRCPKCGAIVEGGGE